jgi:hypothetical protein
MDPALHGWLTNDVSTQGLANRMRAFFKNELHASEDFLRQCAKSYDRERRLPLLEEWLLGEKNSDRLP